MAAYATTVTLDHRAPAKFGNGGFKIVSGKVAITNYNQTLAEITGITGAFRTILNVVTDGASTTGYLIVWDRTAKSFKAFVPTTQAQVASDTDVGVVNFLAFGI